DVPCSAQASSRRPKAFSGKGLNALPGEDAATTKHHAQHPRAEFMKRRDFLKVTGIGAVGTATLAAPAIAQSMPALKWRMTASWPKSLDTLWGGAELLTKYVAEA